MKREVFIAYANSVAEQFHLTMEEMFEKTKKRENVDARQILYYLCMERPIRISYIQRFMEDHGHPVSHSTIIHGYKKAKELIDNDSDYHDILKKAESNI
jgi:chromosomal replication initiation ATPase DnaA